MPARKRTGGSASSSVQSSTSNDRSADRDDEEYRLRRKRNNDAVKKTRAKSKETAKERKLRVQNLKSENQQLEAKIDEKKKHINTLKEILIASGKTYAQEEMINSILEEGSDDDDDDEAS